MSRVHTTAARGGVMIIVRRKGVRNRRWRGGVVAVFTLAWGGLHIYIYMYDMYAVGRVDVNSIGNTSPASLARRFPPPKTSTEYNNNKYAYYIYAVL